MIDLLRDNPLFQSCSLEVLERIKPRCKKIPLKRKQVLFQEGDKGEGFYIVKKGLVRLFVNSADKRARALRFVEPGDSFGEAALFGVEKFPVAVDACTTSEVIFVPKQAVMEEMKGSWDMVMSMLRSLSVRLKTHVQTIQLLTAQEVPTRVALFLQQVQSGHPLTKSGWVVVNLKLSRRSLASRLGAAPETIGRVLKKFEEAGLVQMDGQKIAAIHTDKLAEHLSKILSKSHAGRH